MINEIEGAKARVSAKVCVGLFSAVRAIEREHAD